MIDEWLSLDLVGVARDHAGLVCMNGPAGMNLELQCELFSAALDEIGNADQLVNEVIEVDMETAVGEITIRRYTLPD